MVTQILSTISTRKLMRMTSDEFEAYCNYLGYYRIASEDHIKIGIKLLQDKPNMIFSYPRDRFDLVEKMARARVEAELEPPNQQSLFAQKYLSTSTNNQDTMHK